MISMRKPNLEMLRKHFKYRFKRRKRETVSKCLWSTPICKRMWVQAFYCISQIIDHQKHFLAIKMICTQFILVFLSQFNRSSTGSGSWRQGLVDLSSEFPWTWYRIYLEVSEVPEEFLLVLWQSQRFLISRKGSTRRLLKGFEGFSRRFLVLMNRL